MNRRTKQTINYKYKICGHLLALESLLNAREFVNKPKKGGQKKSTKSLEKD